MNTETVLRKDGSFDTYTNTEGLPKALSHKAIVLNVETGVWSIYHHRNYDPGADSGPTAYDANKWYALG